MLTLLQIDTKESGKPGLRKSGCILGKEARCLPIPTSCALIKTHASKVFGYSLVLAPMVEKEMEKHFVKNISRIYLTSEKK
jgi:hypothetical protein